MPAVGVSSINLDVRSLIDGFSIAGGTTARTFTLTSANVTLVGQQDCSVTLPNYATTTLVATNDYAAKGSILSASAANTISALAVGANGMVLTADSSQTTGLTWSDPNPISTITASQTATINTTYIIDSTAVAIVNLALPTTAPVGSYVSIYNRSPNLWALTQTDPGQQIHFLSSSTTLGVAGSLESTATYDAIKVVCVVANTTWLVVSSSGNFILN